MKHLLFYFLLLFFFSCRTDNLPVEETKASLENSKQLETVSSHTNAKSIVGKWGVYVSGSESMDVLCNICPEISFKEDATGIVTYPSGEKDLFQWEAANDKLIIKTTEAVDSSIITDGMYGVSFTRENEYVELKLTDVNTKNFYILRK